MPRLIIANNRTAQMVGELAELPPIEREIAGCSALRLLWHARSGDVVVVPRLPRPELLAYVCDLTGTDLDSLVVLAPPEGELGGDLLTADRTGDAGFRERLAAAVRQQSITEVLIFCKDVASVRLVDSVGLTVPGRAFSAQGGDAILNSKAGFRAIAAGAGAPIAEGLATTRSAEAVDLVTELLAAGHSAILKQEFCCGGTGNEILTPTAGVRTAGALSAVVLSNPAEVADYFDQRWDWLTAGGRHQLVIERYFPDCDTVYGEYLIDEDGPLLVGLGEILMSPIPVGEIVPPQALFPAARTVLIEAGTRIADAVHAIGFRGYFSTDAVLTPAGEIFITETNARMSGSTHLNVVFRSRVLEPAHRDSRVLLEMHDWPVPSFATAVQRLDEAGLTFRRDTGTGVLLTTDLMPDGTVTYCVVAEDLPTARTIEAELATLFGEATPGAGDAATADRGSALQASCG